MLRYEIRAHIQAMHLDECRHVGSSEKGGAHSFPCFFIHPALTDQTAPLELKSCFSSTPTCLPRTTTPFMSASHPSLCIRLNGPSAVPPLAFSLAALALRLALHFSQGRPGLPLGSF